MRHGTQLAPDGSVPNSHELARCAACESILYDVPVLLDGIPLGKVAWRCPHCHDGRPLGRVVVARQRLVAPIPVDPERQDSLRRRARKAAETRQFSDDTLSAVNIAAAQAFAARVGRTPTYDEMGQTGCPAIPGLSSITMLRRLFGSLRGFILAAGLTPRPGGWQVTAAPKEGAA